MKWQFDHTTELETTNARFYHATYCDEINLSDRGVCKKLCKPMYACSRVHRQCMLRQWWVHWSSRTLMTSRRGYAWRWRRQWTVIISISTRLKPDTTVKPTIALTMIGFDDDDVSEADCWCCCCCCCCALASSALALSPAIMTTTYNHDKFITLERGITLSQLSWAAADRWHCYEYSLEYNSGMQLRISVYSHTFQTRYTECSKKQETRF